MTSLSSSPRGEHTPRAGATWDHPRTEVVIPDDAPDPRPGRAERRALARAARRNKPMTDQPLPSINARDVHGFCPACGHPTLRLGEDARITCTLMDCPRPDLVNELIGEIGDARHHAAYTFCEQLVGHVNMTAFANKITEKVTAVAQRAEAVAYANEQKQRAENAEATLTRIAALADEHPAGIDTALIHAALAGTETP